MGEVVKLVVGRRLRAKKIPKPVLCKECDEPIETARLQACAGDIMRCTRCIACQRDYDRRFDREMAAVRHWQSVSIIR